MAQTPIGTGPTTVGTTTTTRNPRQLSDGNSAGTALGQSATDKIAFFTDTAAGAGVPGPVMQQGGVAVSVSARGQGGASVMTFASVQSPSSVATLTSAEKSVTVQSGTASTLTPKSGDVFIVNKIAAQAGLGVGNIRYSAAGVVGLTFSNFTSGTLTPTTTEIYGIIGVRGASVVTAVLTPAAVASSTTAEQIFTVTARNGVPLYVNKPTSQAGLDIAGCRVAADNSVGITFVNMTAGVLTPTAAETYTFFISDGIDVASNEVFLVANSTLTPATVANITTADVTLTSNNVLVDDTVIGVQKPTLQAGLGVVASRVSAASTLKITFVNPTAGVLSPTASEDYVVSMFRPNPAAPFVVYTPTLSPASVAANTTAEQTFTVTGLVAASGVIVNKPTWQQGLGIMGVRVSALNTLAVTFINATGTTITPAAGEVYQVGNFQALIDTTAGNAVIQGFAPAMASTARLANGLKSSLGPSGYNLVAP